VKKKFGPFCAKYSIDESCYGGYPNLRPQSILFTRVRGKVFWNKELRWAPLLFSAAGWGIVLTIPVCAFYCPGKGYASHCEDYVVENVMGALGTDPCFTATASSRGTSPPYISATCSAARRGFLALRAPWLRPDEPGPLDGLMGPSLRGCCLFWLRRCQASLSSSYIPGLGSWRLRQASSDVSNYGGASRDRTDDLIVANDALSQLSYSPVQVGKLPNHFSSVPE
jgi:hypothetical protein